MLDKRLASCLASNVKCFAFRYESLLKTIRGNNIYRFVKQLFAFSSGDLTNGSEAVGLVRCGFFNRMLADHIELLSHLVAVIALEVVIERFVVTCDRATDAGSMGSEEGTNLRAVLL